MSENVPDAELTALERSLAGLTPRVAGLSRERMLFEAGRNCRPRSRLWPALAGLSTLAATVLAVLILTRPATVIVEQRVEIRTREVYVERPPEPVQPKEPSETTPEEGEPLVLAQPQGEYLRLREDVLRWGMDALPAPMASVSPDAHLLSPEDLLARPGKTSNKTSRDSLWESGS